MDETDNAWADLYSAAISIQNVFPKIRQRWLILGLGIFSFLVAVVLDITQFENFLLLTGSFFIPLFGILTADYFLLRGQKYPVSEFFRSHGAYWFHGGLNIWGLIAWIVGLLVYHVTNPTTLGAFIPGWTQIVPRSLTLFGGSLPSFMAAFIAYTVFALAFLRSKPTEEIIEPGGVTMAKNNSFGAVCAELLARIHDRHPLVHHITNYVVMNDTANLTLALGALPVMAHAKEEVAEMVGAAGALVLNPGTLTPEWVEAMLIAAKRANELGIPVIYDPVGVGATRLRNETGERFLSELRLAVVRGNSGEVGALAGAGGRVKGVESVEGVKDPVQVARNLAA